MSGTKRVTLDLTSSQHKKLKDGSKSLGLTQQEALSLIVDLTMSNPETIRQHADRFLRKKKAEEQKAKDMDDKAKRLIS